MTRKTRRRFDCLGTKRLLPLLAFAAALALSAAGYAQVSPAVFAPAVVSTPAHEGPIALAPDGRVYFLRYAADMAAPRFFVSGLQDGGWSPVQPAILPDGIAPAPICFSPDGRQIFYSHAPDASRRTRLWTADRQGAGWSKPRPLGGALDKWEGDQLSPSVTSDGTLYFVSDKRGLSGGWDVYRSLLKDGEYQEPELLAGRTYSGVSTILQETGVTVAADGTFLVFTSVGAPDGIGGSDLYIAELPGPSRDTASVRNLGRLVNGAGDEADPRLSPDGKRLYFSRAGDVYAVDVGSVRRARRELGAWTVRGSLPVGRRRAQAAGFGGRLFVYGTMLPAGPNGAATRNHVDVYDPASGSWSSLPPAPAAFDSADIVATGDRLLLFLPCAGERPAVAEFDPALNGWRVTSEPGATAREGRCSGETRTVALGGKIFTILRASAIRPYSALLEYDPRTNASTPRRSPPVPAWHFAAHNGRIYAFGAGEDSTGIVAYDPGADAWSDAGLMHMPLWGTALASLGDEIWLVGGHGQRGFEPLGTDPLPWLARFDPVRRSWSYGPDLPAPRLLGAAAVVDGHLFIVGGSWDTGRPAASQPLLEHVPGERADGER